MRRIASQIPDAEELDIQRVISDYLTLARVPHAVTNVAPKGWVRRGRRKDAGWPDICACFKGRFVGLEVKTRTGKAREAQQECHAAIRQAGGIVAVVRTLDDVIGLLAEV